MTRTAAKVKEYMNRPLDELKLVALLLDGINIGEHTVVVALGVGHDGTKTPLGIWLGSTENARVCTELLGNLTSRGLKVEDRILCVIDGGKGIRKALVDVFGNLALIQRCQDGAEQASRAAGQGAEEPSIESSEKRALGPATEHDELLAENQVLGDQRRAGRRDRQGEAE